MKELILHIFFALFSFFFQTVVKTNKTRQMLMFLSFAFPNLLLCTKYCFFTSTHNTKSACLFLPKKKLFLNAYNHLSFYLAWLLGFAKVLFFYLELRFLLNHALFLIGVCWFCFPLQSDKFEQPKTSSRSQQQAISQSQNESQTRR